MRGTLDEAASEQESNEHTAARYLQSRRSKPTREAAERTVAMDMPVRKVPTHGSGDDAGNGQNGDANEGQPVCEHGATAYVCRRWGCKFYEIPNGRR